MLSDTERQKKIKYKPQHIFQRIKERKHLFPNGAITKKCIDECFAAIKNRNRGVFVKDNRNDSQSSHVCIFVGESGEIIALPCKIDDENIVWLTIKDVRKDTSNPNWFVNSYNEVAKTRGLPSLPLIFRGIEGGI